MVANGEEESNQGSGLRIGKVTNLFGGRWM